MKNTLETRLGIFFAVALVATAIILEIVGGFEFLKSGMRLEARFGNIQELKLGDPVKMGGKQIGRIEAIEFDGQQLLVQMKITDGEAVVRTDSTATIKFSGLMGQNFIDINFGPGEGVPLTEGQALVTEDPKDLGEVIAKLDGVATDVKRITGNLADIEIDELILPFTDFMKDSRPRLTSILTNVQSVMGTVAAGEGTVGKLLMNEELYASAMSTVTNLNRTVGDAQATLSDARAIMADVRAGKGTVGKLASDDQLYNELTEAATNLKEVMQKVNQGKGSVGALVNDNSLIRNANLTLQKLDKATDSLEDQGPLTVLSIVINPLF